MIENQPSSLSIAYAERSIHESDLFDKASNEAKGRKYIPLTIEERERMIKLLAKTMDKLVEAQDSSLQSIAIMRNYHYSLHADEITNRIQTNMVQKEALDDPFLSTLNKDISGASRNISEDATDIFYDNNALQASVEHGVRLLRIAKEMAGEKGVEPESVFKDENLYIEAVRRSDSPEEFAARYLYVLRGFTSEVAESIFEKLVTEIISQDPLLGMIKGILNADEKKDLIEHLFYQNSEFKESIRTIALDTRRGTAQAVIAQIERFWGPGAANMLPPEQRLALLFPEENQG